MNDFSEQPEYVEPTGESEIAEPEISVPAEDTPDQPDEYWAQVAGPWMQPATGAPDPSRIESQALVWFESLTLGEALEELLMRPVVTLRLFWQVLARDPSVLAEGERITPDDWPPEDEPEPEGGSTDDESGLGGDPGDDELPGDGAPVADEMARIDDEDSAAAGDLLDSVEMVAHVSPNLPFGAWVVLIALVVVLALIGGRALHGAAVDPVAHMQANTRGAGWWFGLAALMYAGAELLWQRDRWLAVLGTQKEKRPPESAEPTARPSRLWDGDPLDWVEEHVAQLFLLPVALILSALAFNLNVARDAQNRVRDVVLTTEGFVVWLASIGAWLAVMSVDVQRVLLRFSPARDQPRRQTPIWKTLQPAVLVRRASWPLVVIAVITGLGLAIRLDDLSAVPPEMTSDHIEKLLDSLKIYDGYRGIFFPNNGGREGFQMYVVALIGGPLGVGFNFDALKWATVIEGVITLPALWWMARQIVGTATEDQRRLGHWVGIALAALVAVSSWHLMLSRLGLRIVLTPLTTALVIGLLARVMRHNRLGDFLALGFVLGAGMYFYQANRMLPLLAVAGVGLAAAGQVRSRHDLRRVTGYGLGLVAVALAPLVIVLVIGRGLAISGEDGSLNWLIVLVAMLWFSVVALISRATEEPVLRYGGGLLAAGVIALAVYVPMFHYSELYSDQFWSRTRGRLFGDNVFMHVNPTTGRMESYDPSMSEQVERFWDQRDVFLANYQDALEMYHWEGDAAWINNAHGYPALDWAVGGLLVAGLTVGVGWALRRRESVPWLLPVAVLIMLLPSAMTLAYTIENPSFTRASGTIPPIFMLAALPLGLVCWQMARLKVGIIPVGHGAALLLIAIICAASFAPNRENFFADYRLNYSYSWKPYHEIAQPLRAFAESEGSYGNAFMIAYPHWLDHRILGTMAGDIRWPNGVVQRTDLPDVIARNAGTPYEYDPTVPLFVMYHRDDSETAAYLDELFPGGRHELYEYRYETLEPGFFEMGTFYIFSVDAGEIDEFDANSP